MILKMDDIFDVLFNLFLIVFLRKFLSFWLFFLFLIYKCLIIDKIWYRIFVDFCFSKNKREIVFLIFFLWFWFE